MSVSSPLPRVASPPLSARIQSGRAARDSKAEHLRMLALDAAHAVGMHLYRGDTRRQQVDTLRLMNGLYESLHTLLVDVLDDGDKRANPTRKQFIPRTLHKLEAITDEDLGKIVAAEKFAESGEAPTVPFRKLLRGLSHLTEIPPADDPVWSIRWRSPSAAQ